MSKKKKPEIKTCVVSIAQYESHANQATKTLQAVIK